jgi:hypothetical protein
MEYWRCVAGQQEQHGRKESEMQQQIKNAPSERQLQRGQETIKNMSMCIIAHNGGKRNGIL